MGLEGQVVGDGARGSWRVGLEGQVVGDGTTGSWRVGTRGRGSWGWG